MVDSNLWLPLVASLVATALTLLLFWAWSKHAAKPKRKTKHVTEEDLAHVRRSSRPRKSVSRWSPDDIGSPTGYSREKLPGSPVPVQKAAEAGISSTATTPKAKTPRAKSSLAPAKAAAKEAVSETVAKRGRPRKIPVESK